MLGKEVERCVSCVRSVWNVGWLGGGVAGVALPGQGWSPAIPWWRWIGASGIVRSAAAGIGISAVAMISLIAVPAITLLGLFAVGKAFSDFGGIEAWWHLVPTEQMSFSQAIGICIASFISGGTLTAAFTRFSTNPTISVPSTVLASFIGNSFLFPFGAVGSVLYQRRGFVV